MIYPDKCNVNLLLSHLGMYGFAVFLLTLVTSWPTASGREWLSLAGQRGRSELMAIAADGAVTLSPPVPGVIKLDDLVSWGAPAELVESPVIVLVGGGILAQPQRGATAAIAEETLRLSSSRLGALAIPLELVRGTIFRLPANRQQRDRLVFELLQGDERREGDRLRLENGDRVTGTVLALGEKGERRECELKTPGGTVQLDVARIESVQFDPSLLAAVPRSTSVALVGLADGSRFEVTHLELTNETVTFAPRAGLGKPGEKWQAPRSALVFVQPLRGGVRYLSDLPVDSYKHIPYLTQSWPYELDRNVIGTQLRAGGRLYAKGIGMHSAARLTFSLDDEYAKFEASLAIDDHTTGRGHVTCRVFVDGEERYQSGPIQGGAAPLPLSVEIRGGKLLSLIVDFGDGGDTLDRVDWLDARLVK